MSLRISIPKSDLAKGITIEAGWQPFTIGKPYPKTSKDQKSVNYVVPHILDNDINGRTVDHYFNSQALGMMAPFIAALSNLTVKEVLEAMKTDTLEFDLEAIEGKKILGLVKHEEYQGRPQAKISNWADPSKVPF